MAARDAIDLALPRKGGFDNRKVSGKFGKQRATRCPAMELAPGPK
jgi:hypothetical protein